MELSVTVVVPASRPRALRRLLESLAAADRPEDFECLVVLNGREAECAAAVADLAGRLPGLRALPAPRPRSLGAARNAAVPEARGRWLCFLDDDVRVPRGYFRDLAAAARASPEAVVIGGPNLTPAGSSLVQRCCGHLLASPLCAGPMSRRYRAGGQPAWTDDTALILCNLAVSRAALLEDGLLFDETLVRNEENLLLEQLRARGRRALFVPELAVEHERRDGARAFARQCFLSGRGRAEMTFKRPSSLRPIHAAPALLWVLAFCCAAAPRLAGPWAASYGLACAANGLWLAARRREGPAAAAAMALLGPLAQLSYGAGLLAGALVALVRDSPAKTAPAPVNSDSSRASTASRT